MANRRLAKDHADTCVLVTGGAGFIGSHTVVELLARGYHVVVVDDLSNSSEVALERVRAIAGLAPDDSRLVFYEDDILERDALARIFDAHDIDAIIHFAGFKAVGESVQKPLEYYWNNVAGTLVLCEAARAAGCKNLVFSSSATVSRPVWRLRRSFAALMATRMIQARSCSALSKARSVCSSLISTFWQTSSASCVDLRYV